MYYVMYNKYYKKINLIYLLVLIISGTCFSQNSNSKITKADEMVFIESLQHMVEKKYIKKLSGNSAKAKAYNVILELMD